MTSAEISEILLERPTQPSDFNEPQYKVWYTTFVADRFNTPVHQSIEDLLPIFLARMVAREIKKKGYAQVWIEVE